jgi:hypothetical protein
MEQIRNYLRDNQSQLSSLQSLVSNSHNHSAKKGAASNYSEDTSSKHKKQIAVGNMLHTAVTQSGSEKHHGTYSNA